MIVLKYIFRMTVTNRRCKFMTKSFLSRETVPGDKVLDESCVEFLDL